jgi:ribosomal protein S18 acetylase RimI-like enzyme
LSDSFTISLPVIVRPCRASDLEPLEWFGLITPFRQTIQDAFERMARGEVLMLIAEANRFPIGQVWVDLARRRPDPIGVLFAFRVLLPFQNLGVGTRLIEAAEAELQARNYRTAEIGVEKDNPAARRLYERLGYRVVREVVEEWEYTPPGGEAVRVRSDEWILQKPLTAGATGA